MYCVERTKQRKRAVFSLFLFIFCIIPILNSSLFGKALSEKKKELDDNISALRDQLSYSIIKSPIKNYKQLVKLSKQRIMLDYDDDEAKLQFIDDDLAFSKGQYSLHLLKSMKSPSAKLKLIEINLDEKRLGKKLRVKNFTLSRFQAFLKFFKSDNVYMFSRQNALEIFNDIDSSKLTPLQLEKYIFLKNKLKIEPLNYVLKQEKEISETLPESRISKVNKVNSKDLEFIQDDNETNLAYQVTELANDEIEDDFGRNEFDSFEGMYFDFGIYYNPFFDESNDLPFKEDFDVLFNNAISESSFESEKFVADDIIKTDNKKDYSKISSNKQEADSLTQSSNTNIESTSIKENINNSIKSDISSNGIIPPYHEVDNSASPVFQVGNGLHNSSIIKGQDFLPINPLSTNISSVYKMMGINSGVLKSSVLSKELVDISIDTSKFLNLSRTINKKEATKGEIVSFNISILNNSDTFSSFSDFLLIDTLPSGVKYITGSSKIDNEVYNDPLIIGNKIKFSLPSIENSKTINISYQAIVSTGLANGSYTSSSICKQINESVLISNLSKVVINVVPDTLFSNSALIGRVYEDLNDNGKFDDGEPGVKNAVVATEYGVLVTADENGMYHIKNIFAGRHTLQLVPIYLPKGKVSRNPHGFPFEVIEGTMTKVNIPVVDETSDNKSKEFVFVSLGEVTLSDNNVRGNMEMVDKDSSFDDGFNVSGRGAFFLQGKILGKYLITASYDSERLSSKQKQIRRNRLFTNLDPEKYYPVYGDGSKVDYSATETSGALYLLMEWEDVFGKWVASFGNMEINWQKYRKVTNGAKIVLESLEKTEFNNSSYQVEAFYAESDFNAFHEEFTGTGTSLYHLKHVPIIEGSERVKVQIKNRFSNISLLERTLKEEIDYNIDYERGRITLKKPLTSIILNYDQSIISNDILAGERVHLIIDYEYRIFSLMNKDTFGGRVSKSIGDNLVIEGGYVEEERDLSPYKLTTMTASYKVNKNTSFIASYNESKQFFADGGMSYDSGLTFLNALSSFDEEQEGALWSIAGNTLLFEKLSLNASYSETDSGYSALGTFSGADSTIYEANLSYALNDIISFGVKHQKNESVTNDNTLQSIYTLDYLKKTNVFIDINEELWDSRLEYIYQDIGSLFNEASYVGILAPQGKELIALRLGWKPFEGHHYYVVGQTAIENDIRDKYDSDMITLGLKFPIFETMDVLFEKRTGTIGSSTLASLIVNQGEDQKSFIGFETGNHIENGAFQSFSFSKSYLNDNGSIYKFTKDYSYYNNRMLAGDIMDIDIPLSNQWSFGFGYENANIDEEDIQNAISREVGTFRYNYLNNGFLKLFGKIEWREDVENSTNIVKEHIYVEDDISFQLADGLSILAKGKLGYADSEAISEDIFKFKQAGAGFAFRPVDYDWINILARYTYTYDLPLDNSSDFIAQTTERKKVTSIDGIFDLTDYLQLVKKIAYRKMEERTASLNWQQSNTFLWVTGLNLEFLDNWIVGCEYRILGHQTFDDKKTGYLFQLKRGFNESIYVTLGYNFTDFDDDLNNRDDYDRGGGFIRLEGRY